MLSQDCVFFTFKVRSASFHHLRKGISLVIIDHLFDGGKRVHRLHRRTNHSTLVLYGVRIVYHILPRLDRSVIHSAEQGHRACGASAKPYRFSSRLRKPLKILVNSSVTVEGGNFRAIVVVFHSESDFLGNFRFKCGKKRLKAIIVTSLIKECEKISYHSHIKKAPGVAVPRYIHVLAKVKTVISRIFKRYSRPCKRLHKKIVVVVRNKVCALHRKSRRFIKKLGWIFLAYSKIELGIGKHYFPNCIKEKPRHSVVGALTVRQNTAKGDDKLSLVLCDG